jgi:predicted GH43/DUF377 family glycosyl hydrolase
MVDVALLGCNGGWEKYYGNPVVGGDLGDCCDVVVLEEGDELLMYFSWRSTKSIAVVRSEDGLRWSEPIIALEPRQQSGWEDDVNRPCVLKRGGRYHMWYSGQVAGNVINAPNRLEDDERGVSHIGYAWSDDGLVWNRADQPVLIATQRWEKRAVMCPHVIFDDELGCYRMWYSAGGWFEPDSIGYAVSGDGQHWVRASTGPVFTPDARYLWERERVTACQVIKLDGWHYMFYIGFEDIDKARVCLARSRDGISHWERHKENPIISGGRAGGWDCEAAYKPFVLFRDDYWMMWYNGRRGYNGQIGVAFHQEVDLGFQ